MRDRVRLVIYDDAEFRQNDEDTPLRELNRRRAIDDIARARRRGQDI